MKKIITYIGKTLQGAVVVTAAVALLGGGLLCCCIAKTAHASASVKSCCHKNKAQKTEPAKTCDHCKIRTSIDSDIVKTLSVVPSLVKALHFSWTADVLTYRPQARFAVHLACAGPPRTRSSLPLYLQLSTLRL